MGRGWMWRAVVAVVGVVGMMGLGGCNGFFVNPNSGGGGGGGSTGSNVVYVANATAQTVSGWVIGTGTLTAVSGLPGALGYVPTAMAVSRANTYVWISSGQATYAYTIGSGGTLSAVGAVAAYGMYSMDVSPDGQWLVGLDVAASLTVPTLDVFQIDTSTGGLTLLGQAQFSTTGTAVPKQVRFAPSGGYVFAAMGTGGVVEIAFNTSSGTAAYNGVAILPASTGTATSDNAVAVNAASSIVYVARSGTNQVLAYGIGSTGNLTAVTGSPYATGNAPYDVAVVGSYLYVANRSDGTVGGYTVGSTGGLAALSGSPFASGSLVQSLVVDSTGTYLFAAGNGGAPDLTAYSFSSGALTTVATETPAANDGAVVVAATH